jgi:CDP-diacylglycerol---glycerol-3-phosphate 3-phosphatidyltransferase
MFLSVDLIHTLILLGVTLLIAVAYTIRVWMKGHARFYRIDRQGGSSLLSKEVMQGAYWALQPIGKFLAACHITANQITWTSLFFGLAAGACLAFGHFGSAAVFATISTLLDALDGMVARATHAASDAGEVLDAAVDRYVEFFFMFGLVIYYREVPVLLGLSLVALLGSFMVSYSTAKAEALHIDVPKGSMRRPERSVYLIMGAALSPVTIPYWETMRPYTIAVGHPMVAALVLIAVLANVSAIERFWVLSKAIRVREANELLLAQQKQGTANDSSMQDDPFASPRF